MKKLEEQPLDLRQGSCKQGDTKWVNEAKGQEEQSGQRPIQPIQQSSTSKSKSILEKYIGQQDNQKVKKNGNKQALKPSNEQGTSSEKIPTKETAPENRESGVEGENAGQN